MKKSVFLFSCLPRYAGWFLALSFILSWSYKQNMTHKTGESVCGWSQRIIVVPHWEIQLTVNSLWEDAGVDASIWVTIKTTFHK